MAASTLVEHRMTYGDPTLDATAPPIALQAAAAVQLARGGESRTTPIFRTLTDMGQYHPRRNAVEKPKPSVLVCAAGRYLNNRTRMGGLVWDTPCFAPVRHQIGLQAGQLGFCGRHGEAILAALDKQGRTPDQTSTVDGNTGEQILCDAGRLITRPEDRNWNVACPLDPSMYVYMDGNPNPLLLCHTHGQLLDDEGHLEPVARPEMN